jgi:hypothetical protein
MLRPGRCIPVRFASAQAGVDGIEVLLISSSGGKGLVFPKARPCPAACLGRLLLSGYWRPAWCRMAAGSKVVLPASSASDTLLVSLLCCCCLPLAAWRCLPTPAWLDCFAGRRTACLLPDAQAQPEVGLVSLRRAAGRRTRRLRRLPRGRPLKRRACGGRWRCAWQAFYKKRVHAASSESQLKTCTCNLVVGDECWAIGVLACCGRLRKAR